MKVFMAAKQVFMSCCWIERLQSRVASCSRGKQAVQRCARGKQAVEPNDAMTTTTCLFVLFRSLFCFCLFAWMFLLLLLLFCATRAAIFRRAGPQ